MGNLHVCGKILFESITKEWLVKAKKVKNIRGKSKKHSLLITLRFISAQYDEENSNERSKDEKLLYTGLKGILQGFQKYFFQNPRN